MSYLSLVKRELNVHFPTIYGDIFDKKDPDELPFNGSQVYHGMQRQGKTLSMVKHSRRLKRKYPKLLVVCNIWLSYLEPVTVANKEDLEKLMRSDAFQSGLWQQTHYIRYKSHDSLLMLLQNARGGGGSHETRNYGKWGVHFMIDEIHQYFHSHDSKSMPVWVATVFSQQGKQYILVTATVQVWDNVIKALREQIQNLIQCKKFGWLITQTVVDPEQFESEYGERVAPVKKKGFFFITRDIRESYDTRELINSGREIFGGSDMQVNVKMAEPVKKSGIFGGSKQARR